MHYSELRVEQNEKNWFFAGWRVKCQKISRHTWKSRRPTLSFLGSGMASRYGFSLSVFFYMSLGLCFTVTRRDRNWILRCKRYLCSNPNLLSDLYDALRWERVMRHATICLSRIDLQLCWDGFLAFQQGLDCSYLETSWIYDFSCRTWESREGTLLLMLILLSLKDKESRKYLDWAADFEINDLKTSIESMACVWLSAVRHLILRAVLSYFACKISAQFTVVLTAK